jgi:hypothetical protein
MHALGLSGQGVVGPLLEGPQLNAQVADILYPGNNLQFASVAPMLILHAGVSGHQKDG